MSSAIQFCVCDRRPCSWSAVCCAHSPSSIPIAIRRLPQPSSTYGHQVKSYRDEWETNTRVKCVLVESSSSHSFSAGYAVLNPKFMFLN
ncbi:hypothetical protein ACS0TY_031276 [Phlomoides rotata]